MLKYQPSGHFWLSLRWHNIESWRCLTIASWLVLVFRWRHFSTLWRRNFLNVVKTWLLQCCENVTFPTLKQCHLATLCQCWRTHIVSITKSNDIATSSQHQVHNVVTMLSQHCIVIIIQTWIRHNNSACHDHSEPFIDLLHQNAISLLVPPSYIEHALGIGYCHMDWCFCSFLRR